ncbi:M16 family metallopeptidase [Pseudomonas frederiksbergensis]|nr:pitrilysin family protein [Pseudomonas frederiksbergensis]
MNTTTNNSVTTEFTLDNGLKVVVRQDHRKPAFCSAVTYGVGAFYEEPQERGLSSVVTQALLNNDEQAVVKELGGDFLTHWGEDSMTHQLSLPREHLDTAFKLQAAMMMRAPQDDVFQQHQENELAISRRTSNFVSAVTFGSKLEALIEIGTRYYSTPDELTQSLEQLTLDQIQQWRNDWYVPANAVLVVTGDITPDEVKPLAEEHFGVITQADVPYRDFSVTPPAPGYRQLTQQLETQHPLMLVVFNVPSLATNTDVQSARALQVMTSLLTNAAPQRLVTPGFNPAHTFANHPQFMRGDSRFSFAFYFEGEAQTAEADFWAWLDEVKSTLFTTEEIEPAIQTASANAGQRIDRLEGASRTIGQLITNGCPRQLLDVELEQLGNVTPADIQSTAQMWLTRERATVGHVFPMDK